MKKILKLSFVLTGGGKRHTLLRLDDGRYSLPVSTWATREDPDWFVEYLETAVDQQIGGHASFIIKADCKETCLINQFVNGDEEVLVYLAVVSLSRIQEEIQKQPTLVLIAEDRLNETPEAFLSREDRESIMKSFAAAKVTE